jgi:uncharacterized protein (DUF2267 family)
MKTMEPQETIGRQALLEQIIRHGGAANVGAAAAALKATLATLGDRLPDNERNLLAGALPQRVAKVLHAHRYGGPFDIVELYDRVARREGVPLGAAREHVQVVCRVLGEVLPEHVVSAVQAVIPSAFAELFTSPPAGHPPPHHARIQAPALSTLASGKPGSLHPLSESRPPGAQSHSVVHEGNPHQDTKLSSASGLTQERADDSLASSQPDTSRTIAEAHD